MKKAGVVGALALAFVLGAFTGGWGALRLAQITSREWASSQGLDLAFQWQMETYRAAQAQDWVRFQGLLEAQSRVNAVRLKGSWPLEFPLFGWVLAPIVQDTLDANDGPLSPWLTESLIAYALARQGKTEEASARYAALEKKYPGRTRAVFEAAAEGTLKGVSAALAASDGKPAPAPSPHP